MSATRNISDLVIGKSYKFIRDYNGYTSVLKYMGTTQAQRSDQNAQYFGNKNPIETVYEFTMPNGFKQWVWSDCQNDKSTAGVWVPDE
jgi:hypothetical protein